MQNWHLGPLAGFDLETTGTDPCEARIVTCAVVARGQAPADQWALVRLFNPGIDIPEEATAVHGITTTQAQAAGLPPDEVLPELLAALRLILGNRLPLVIYNAPYDLTVLACEARRYGLLPLDLSEALIVDPLVLDKQLDRFRKGSRRLGAVCEHYGVTLDDAHEAEADALAAMRVAWRIARRYPLVTKMNTAALMGYQARARRAQANSLAAYFRRTGKPQPVNGDWPVHVMDEVPA